MTSTTTDVIDGVSGSTAIKAPVRVATTTNITLSGTQTIDGVAVVADDRVLVKDQTTASENGIYNVSATAWSRAADFDGNRDVRNGTLIIVNSGTVNEDTTWRCTSSDPVVIGTSNITFEAALINDADVIAFTQSGAGAVDRSVQSKLRDVIHVADFGAVGDGSTNDTTALTNWLNAVMESDNRMGVMGAKTYCITAALPQITVPGVTIFATGPTSNHDVGNPANTIIKWTGAAGGTMLTIAPASGASNQRLDGIVLDGIGFNCNALAEKGLVVKSVRNSIFRVYQQNATDTGFELDVQTTLGEGRDTQMNQISYYARQVDGNGAAGVALRLKGDSSANTSFNTFEHVDIVHKNAAAIIHENSDNNAWKLVRIFRASGGTATNSVIWQGGATELASCRDEFYYAFSTSVAAIAKGTGTYTVGAKRIIITNIDDTNSTPSPTIETGTSVFDGRWRSYTPTLSSGSGSFTSATPTGRWRRTSPTLVEVQTSLTITTNGTAAGFARMTLPFTSLSGGFTHPMFGIENVTGDVLRGSVGQNSANMDITLYEGTYPGADGRSLSMSGFYGTAHNSVLL